MGLVGTLAGIAAGLRRGRADARKTDSEAVAVASADNRAWAALFIERLSATETKLDAAEGELATERQAHAATRDRLASAERKIEDLQREVAALIKEVRRLGGHVPGDTPPSGMPTATPTEKDGTS